MSSEPKFAHEIEPHPEEGEAVPLARLVRYHYAQAQAWHLAFAEVVGGQITGGRFDFALVQYLRHAHLAFLHDALAQGLSGQAAADWASERTHSESAELVWERSALWTKGYMAGWDDRHEDEHNPLPAGEQHDTANPFPCSCCAG